MTRSRPGRQRSRGAIDHCAAAPCAYWSTPAPTPSRAAGAEREASLRLRDGDETVLRDYLQHGRLLDTGTRDQAEQSAATAWLADTLSGKHSLLLVDTNEQAARMSAQLRAELVRLGLVEEARATLADGYAGVGDLVQARRNGWDLAGVEGNRRGPVNRENYRVIGVRADGGLDVAPLTGRGSDGETMVLPARYVSPRICPWATRRLCTPRRG